MADKLVATKTITAQDIPEILNAAPTYPDLNAMSTSVQNLLRGVTGEIISTLSRDETANGYLPLDGGVYEKAKYKRLYDRLIELTNNKEFAIGVKGEVGIVFAKRFVLWQISWKMVIKLLLPISMIIYPFLKTTEYPNYVLNMTCRYYTR